MATVQIMPSAPVGQDCNKKYAKIQEGIESTISVDGKARISRILSEIKHLSDVEKLLLYLKLPTGISQDEHLRLTPPPCLHTANRKEQAEAFTWIRSHLEEHGDVCMPKAEVYDEYRQYCESHELRPLCNADFGKMMKQVFPDINTRRLGQRGQSKYFYGGLRKKTDHAPPTLPELEIHTKALEMDSSSLDNEIFKASCLLLCEWADKLLDNKFTSVQSIAEHLVTNLYVNTKSVAAFTLIAAMQESGNSNLKGSALFSSQPSTAGDRHKETNLLLQQKLQKNKLLQKQKEKLQAMKEEMETQNVGQVILPVDRKTPSGSVRKSVTPSRMSKTPKLPSPSPSPVTLPSPHKNQSKHDKNMVALQNYEKPVSNTPRMQQSQTGTVKLTDLPTHQQMAQTGSDKNSRLVTDVSVKNSEFKGVEPSPVYKEDNDSVFTFSESAQKQTNTENQRRRSVSLCDTVSFDESDIEMLDLTSPLEKVQESETEAETPSMEIETNQNTSSHVRKINFDEVLEPPSSNVSCENVSTDNQSTGVTVRNNADMETDDNKETKTDEKLSKSDGHVSLKMLLERKDSEKGSLNKSLGVLEKSKNTLYVNQSTVSGRSAFVPFSQVQNRKDNITVNQAVSQTGIPIFIPSSTGNQSTNVAMIAVPSNVVSGTQQTSASRVPDNIIKLLSVPCSTSFQLQQSSDSEGAQQNIVIQSQCVSMVTDCQTVDSSTPCLTKDTQTLVTTSSVLSKSSSCDSIVSVSPSITSNSTNISKHARTRFTPIRPKASPNKIQPAKETKGDNPAYDKRPVSEILKEKRAKEQAEAIARLQQGMRLPTIPMQPSLVIGRNNLNTPQSLSSNGSPKEVVIIVNNQAGSSGMQTVMAPSMFVTQSVVSKENISQNQPIDDSNSMQTDSGQFTDGKKLTDQIFAAMTTNQEEKEIQEKNNLEDKVNRMEKQADTIMAEPDRESEHLDKVEQMWTETPAKIAKLNITSPYRPESACSLGRDTPVKIMKASDSCSSRPESACSFGRETPSGARKRKSSDYAQRRDFKRLNSTGDEGEDIFNMKLQADILSAEMEAKFGQNPRRTRSCTYELDKDMHVPVTALLTEGLQSPDITSLEREALLESGFPHSLLSGNLHKIHAQTSTVGVGAKALRQSQQKLMKNKTDLDMRVKNFLQKDERFSFQIQPDKGINDLRLPRPKTSQDNLITKDSGKGLKKVDEHSALAQQFGVDMETNSSDMEPSGLPSEVADWINDTIEKRQLQNQSALSEPDMSSFSQKSNLVADLGLTGFKFEVGQPVPGNNENTASVMNKCNKANNKTEENPFTVPKVPALNLRSKDMNARVTPDFYGKSNRCQSLPSFSSPNQSPISPVPPQVARQTLYRAMSMSPRNPQTEVILHRETNTITSPTQRHEHCETHPLSLSIHAGTKLREETSPKPPNRPGSIEEGKSLQTQAGSYLASMQHTLQKPGDNLVEMHIGKPRENDPGGYFTNTQSVVLTAGMNQNMSGKDLVSNMERNVVNVPERYVSQTPFSDSGYHSTGPSPILNSTPVSALMDLEVANPQYTAKTAVTAADIQKVGPELTQQAILQSPNPNCSVEMQVSTGIVGVLQSVSLASPTNSAFIPIQGSNQDTLYVTPIKPTVTLPNAANLDNTLAYSGSLYIEPNTADLTEHAMMISPKSHDPPSYETAIKSLRKTGLPIENTAFQDGSVAASQSNNTMLTETNTGFQKTNYSSPPAGSFQDILESQTESGTKDGGSEERVSLLANMGNTENDRNRGMYGPFASKLVQLSRQTQQNPPTKKPTASSSFTGMKPSGSIVKQTSMNPITESGELLKGSGDLPSINNIPALHLHGSSSGFALNNVNSSSSLVDNLSPNLSKNINQSEGAISSLPYPNQSDLDFISTSHFTSPANEQLSKTSPSLQLSDHSIQNNISHQSFMHFTDISPNNNDQLANQQMMFNFSAERQDQSSFRNFENISVNEMGMKAIQKDISASDAEFADINLTLEALKELDGQYLAEESEMYNTSAEGIQQIGDFPMFED